MHVFLSPHFDDVVFSCGGTVHQLRQNEEPVCMITVMGGLIPDNPFDSPILRELHQRWNTAQNPVIARREEDQAAAKVLGAQWLHLDLPDCVYRAAEDGSALYPHEQSLFAHVHPDDRAPLILASLQIPQLDAAEKLYIPMGIGNHVDHQIVRDWGLMLRQKYPHVALRLYEEYPYMRQAGAVDEARKALSLDLFPFDVVLTEADVDARIHASACYASQMTTFWQDTAQLAAETRQILNQTGQGVPVERCWQPEF